MSKYIGDWAFYKRVLAVMLPMYLIVQCVDALKTLRCVYPVKKGIWINNLAQ